MLSIDAGDAVYTLINGSCQQGTPPGGPTCVEVTTDEPWSCGTLFGPDATGGMVKSEALYSGGSKSLHPIEWDVLYLNVSYYSDSYNLYYGNASSNLELGLLSKPMVKFQDPDMTHIGAADMDSIIDVDSLQTLGRRKDNTSSSDDFTELDGLLSMQNPYEAISLLWSTDGTSPRQNMDFEISGRTIQNVPVINSTSSAAFITGILWDTSDSSDPEFDTREVEDVIFIANYNESQAGTYGIYSYELLIPELLNSYRVGNGRIRFYVFDTHNKKSARGRGLTGSCQRSERQSLAARLNSRRKLGLALIIHGPG